MACYQEAIALEFFTDILLNLPSGFDLDQHLDMARTTHPCSA